jgi:hypothetical protein
MSYENLGRRLCRRTSACFAEIGMTSPASDFSAYKLEKDPAPMPRVRDAGAQEESLRGPDKRVCERGCERGDSNPHALPGTGS